ncbi:MAG: hypothetical protein HY690_19985 [Chloroflexi bacterium]|nr:hypothetical protein [Chloroflexota bacterium]
MLRKADGAAAKGRLQANLTLTPGSRLHARIQDAARVTGMTPTQVLRAVATEYLDEWMHTELGRRRLVQEGEQQSLAVLILDPVEERPQYRGDAGPDADYLEVAAWRVPLDEPVVAEFHDVAVEADVEEGPLAVLASDDESTSEPPRP